MDPQSLTVLQRRCLHYQCDIRSLRCSGYRAHGLTTRYQTRIGSRKDDYKTGLDALDEAAQDVCHQGWRLGFIEIVRVKKHGAETYFVTGVSQELCHLRRKGIHLSSEIELMRHHFSFTPASLKNSAAFGAVAPVVEAMTSFYILEPLVSLEQAGK
jgi:hypothetical protein